MVGYTPCEDTRYGFAVGRVRAREARMLTRQQFERLADTPYAQTGAEGLDEMLEKAASQEEQFFLRYLEEPKMREFFRAPDLAGNMKIALRRHYGAEVRDQLFTTTGSPPYEEYAKLLEGEVGEIPDWLADAAAEVIERNYEELDPASIDLILDNALVEHQYKLARGFSFLTSYLSLHVDLTNLLTMLRLKAADAGFEEFEKAFLPHGSLSLDRFKGWWDQGAEGLASELVGFEPYSKLGEGIRQSGEGFLQLEREAARTELSFLLTARRLTFGYEPLMGYALLKREERRNIRRVITGLRYHLDPQTTRESIAWYD